VESLFPFILLAFAVVLLFVLPARQRKKMVAQQQELQNSLTIGSPILTTAGMHATVAGLGEKTVDLEIAPGVVVTMARQAVLEIRRPAVETPAPGEDNPGTPGSTTAG
jgi:preprotein translocase subunit YajC